MTLDSSTSADMSFAGFTRSGWCTGSTPSPTSIARLKHRFAVLIWNFCADLKAYQIKPSKRRARALRVRFGRIFLGRTGYVTLNRLLARLHANKIELLMVLERPEISLHTNGSENDICCHVTRRKISAGTRCEIGRDCHDAFLSLAKTSDKLGIALWDYLGSRLKVAGAAIVQPLDHYVRARLGPALIASTPIVLVPSSV